MPLTTILQDKDPWLAWDKLAHVLLCFSGVLMGYVVSRRSSLSYYRFPVGFGVGASFGIAKEVGDWLEVIAEADCSGCEPLICAPSGIHRCPGVHRLNVVTLQNGSGVRTLSPQ